jgi:hypothetical protein
MRNGRRLDQDGEGIYSTLVALFIMLVLGAILMETIGSYATDTLTVTVQSNAAAVANQAIQTELVNQCGAAVGTESASPLCTNGLGDFASVAHSGGFTFWVDFFSSWMPTGGLSASCPTSQTPVALLESVFVSWKSRGTYRQLAFSSVEPTPAFVFSYNQSQLGGLCVTNASPLTFPSVGTISHTGTGTDTLGAAVKMLNQAASGATPPNPSGVTAFIPTSYGWYPFLTPGTWTVTCNGSTAIATVTAGTTTPVSC